MTALHVSMMPVCLTEAKIYSSLMSLAIGDALGAPAEFSSRKAARAMQITEMRPNETFGIGPGHWTDDTSMTLALAVSLLKHQGNLNLEDATKRFIAWFKQGYLSSTGSCFDIGTATRATLALHSEPGSFGQKQFHINSQYSTSSKGNGSLMRCSPIALLLYRRIPEHIEPLAALQSTITHPNLACQEACSLYCSLLALILHKAHEIQPLYKDDLLKHIAQYPLQTPEMQERFSHPAVHHPILSKTQDQIKTSGYVVDTLEAVLWHFFHFDNFEAGLIKIIACGDDSDTVGAIYGALAGAFYCDGAVGEGVFWSERMKRWKTALVKVEMLDSLANAMADFGVGKKAELPTGFEL